LEGLRERFLPEGRFRGRQHKKLQFAVLAAVALHSGTQPDLLDEIAWWQTDDFWQYALFAVIACIRAAASRAGVTLLPPANAARPPRRDHPWSDSEWLLPYYTSTPRITTSTGLTGP
jgi:hypothetical protein